MGRHAKGEKGKGGEAHRHLNKSLTIAVSSTSCEMKIGGGGGRKTWRERAEVLLFGAPHIRLIESIRKGRGKFVRTEGPAVQAGLFLHHLRPCISERERDGRGREGRVRGYLRR